MQLTAPQRTLAFWGVCIPTRLYIATLAREKHTIMRVAAALVAANWLSGGVIKSVGFFGGRAWWSRSGGCTGRCGAPTRWAATGVFCSRTRSSARETGLLKIQ